MVLYFQGAQHGDNPGKPSPEVGQDLTDVVAAGVQDGEDRVADGAFQGVAGQAAIGLHVADLGFNRASSAEVDDLLGGQPSACAADQDTGLAFVMPPVTKIDDGKIGTLVCQDRHLLEGLLQGMAIVGVARKAAHADNEAFVQRGGDADLAAELIAHTRLTLGDAVRLGFMQGIDLVAPLGLLMQQLRHQGELGDDPVP